MSPEPRTYHYAGELRGMVPPEPGSLQAGPPTSYNVLSCPDCGALVLDVRQHDRWHPLPGAGTVPPGHALLTTHPR